MHVSSSQGETAHHCGWRTILPRKEIYSPRSFLHLFAFKLDAKLRARALEDEDLEPLRDSLG
ncbi:MAG: hypothetical protein QOE70_3373 [Chthoniobacter sp.]|jgi:hypothetical protein|nr:hypothetical protein [Chthoniobacter sp.]